MRKLKHDRSANVMAFIAFFCTSLLTIIPILRHTYLPLVDLPNHIARHYLATVQDGPLDRYYEYTFGLVPNSAVDILWMLLGTGLDPVDFSRYTMVFYCVSLIASTMFLSRVLHGRWSAWPATSALICFNACFFWGFQNFIVSVPFAILSLAIWLWSEKLSTTQRVLLFAPIAFTLYLLHFFAFAILAIAIFGREIQRIIEAGKAWKGMFLRALLLSAPFAIPIAWLAFDILFGPESPAGSYTAFGSLSERLDVLQSAVIGTDLSLPMALTVTASVTLGLFVILAFAMCSDSIFGGLAIAPQMRGSLLILCIFALIMPTWLNGVAFVHIRFPFVIVALFFSATQWRDISRRNATFIFITVAALLVGRSVALDDYADKHSKQVEDFITLIQDVPSGERLVSVTLEQDASDRQLWHIGAYAVTYRDVFIPTLFQGVHALKVKPEWATYASPAIAALPMSTFFKDWKKGSVPKALEYTQNWNEKYTYLMLMGSPDSTFESMPELDEIAARGLFTLFKITTQ